MVVLKQLIEVLDNLLSYSFSTTWTNQIFYLACPCVILCATDRDIVLITKRVMIYFKYLHLPLNSAFFITFITCIIILFFFALPRPFQRHLQLKVAHHLTFALSDSNITANLAHFVNSNLLHTIGVTGQHKSLKPFSQLIMCVPRKITFLPVPCINIGTIFAITNNSARVAFSYLGHLLIFKL